MGIDKDNTHTHVNEAIDEDLRKNWIFSTPLSVPNSNPSTPGSDISYSTETSQYSRRSSSVSLFSLDEPLFQLDRFGVRDFFDTFNTLNISKKINTSVKNRSIKFKKLASKQKRLLKEHEEDIEYLLKQFTTQIDRLDKRLSSANAVSITEKISFACSLFNIFLCGYVIGHWPNWFHILYTVELIILMPIRIYTYKKKLYHFFLADLCYFVNVLCLLFIWVFPMSQKLFISCYALTFGTLSWAVITWRNSLVLHSLDKLTSTYIHILPPVTFHVITHELSPDYKAARFLGANKVIHWRFMYGMIWTSICYFIWQFSYHYFITIKSKDKIKAGTITSFEWLRKAYAKKPIGRYVNSLPEPYPVIAFSFIQFGYQLSTMLLCPIWYSNIYLSTLFLTMIFSVAAYNGATYYIDVFGKRLEKEVLRLQDEISGLQKKNIEMSRAIARESTDESNFMSSSVFKGSADHDNYDCGLLSENPIKNGDNDSITDEEHEHQFQPITPTSSIDMNLQLEFPIQDNMLQSKVSDSKIAKHDINDQNPSESSDISPSLAIDGRIRIRI